MSRYLNVEFLSTLLNFRTFFDAAVFTVACFWCGEDRWVEFLLLFVCSYLLGRMEQHHQEKVSAGGET